MMIEIPWWFYVLMLPVAWPMYLIPKWWAGLKWAVVAVMFVLSEIALARWLSGGRLARTAAYASAMLFLPPLIFAATMNTSGPDGPDGSIPIPTYIKTSDGRFIEVEGVPEGVDGYVKEENGSFARIAA
jgi:hypothetical protein